MTRAVLTDSERALLLNLAERIDMGEADDTTDLSGSDYRWYQYGQGHVSDWLKRMANAPLRPEGVDSPGPVQA